MKGYVARDKEEGEISDLYFGLRKPIYDEDLEMWHDYLDFISLPKDWFPELKYTDEPIEVELIIKK